MTAISKELTPDIIDTLLSRRFKDDEITSLSKLPSPNLFKDMQKATDRIKSAIENGEKVVIVGDYDVDGVTSTSILKMFFEEIGFLVDWVIPNRFIDGYGFTQSILERVKDYDLIITVDNGISSTKEAKLCRDIGIDLIITDHHLVPKDIPEAYAIINPKQDECIFPNKNICGAQISWYLIASLNKALNRKIEIRKYLPLVSIAIVADIMPLTDINRAMVKFGIKSISKYKTPPIKALLEYLNKDEINSEDIAFQIAPLINSAGRIVDAKYGIEFLMSKTINEARANLKNLISFNTERKYIENQITKEVLYNIEIDKNILVAKGENWHEGVVGIVASRVARITKKPVIVLTKSQDGLHYKGSGRSFTDCNLFHVVNESRELLERFGGHKSAIGLTLKTENVDRLEVEMEKTFQKAKYKNIFINQGLLGNIGFPSINQSLIDILAKYEPYGEGNARPKFTTNSVTISNIKTLGKSGEHQKFYLKKGNIAFESLLFRDHREYRIGEIVDITFTIQENFFNNRTTIQLILESIELSK